MSEHRQASLTCLPCSSSSQQQKFDETTSKHDTWLNTSQRNSELIIYLELIKIQCVVPIFINLFEDPLDVLQTDIVRDRLEEADNLLKIQVTTGIKVYLIEQIQKILGQIIVIIYDASDARTPLQSESSPVPLNDGQSG